MLPWLTTLITPAFKIIGTVIKERLLNEHTYHGSLVFGYVLLSMGIIPQEAVPVIGYLNTYELLGFLTMVTAFRYIWKKTGK